MNGLVDFPIGTAAISSSVLVGCLIVLLLWIICRRPAIFTLHLHCYFVFMFMSVMSKPAPRLHVELDTYTFDEFEVQDRHSHIIIYLPGKLYDTYVCCCTRTLVNGQTGTLVDGQTILPSHWHTVHGQTILPSHWHARRRTVNSAKSSARSSTDRQFCQITGGQACRRTDNSAKSARSPRIMFETDRRMGCALPAAHRSCRGGEN